EAANGRENPFFQPPQLVCPGAHAVRRQGRLQLIQRGPEVAPLPALGEHAATESSGCGPEHQTDVWGTHDDADRRPDLPPDHDPTTPTDAFDRSVGDRPTDRLTRP